VAPRLGYVRRTVELNGHRIGGTCKNMCGLTGFWQPAGAPRAAMETLARQMAERLAHRGPDDTGEWANEKAGVAFGHRRLSIVDLSREGHQPMFSASGRFVIAFNGEIYNFRDVRTALERDGAAPVWRGHSDTEVMLAAFERWGVEGALQRLVGMFAFALWDARQWVLHLARDRLGEKPLYYGFVARDFVFGSELKALLAYPGFAPRIDRRALAAYVQLACVPAPMSIYEGIYKLPPGCVLSLDANQLSARALPEPRAYWSLANAVERGAEPFRGTPEEAADLLELRLREAVAGQMVADVPLGAFLSGGVDSSTVVALMQAQSDSPVRTFSIGFAEQDYDEARHAKRVASHLGTAHTELYVTPQEALAVVPKLSQIYDEPFADSSQIPTFMVSQLARRHVTVSLSGDAGDELFGGYNRYRWGEAIRRRVGWLPPAGRKALSGAITSVPPGAWDGVVGTLSFALPERMRPKAAGDKLHKLARLLGGDNEVQLYEALVSHWPADLVVGASQTAAPWTLHPLPDRLRTLPERMMILDALGYLPDDILVKLDRASMAVSLESRVPLLDHRVVELAWRLPLDMKIRDGQSKWLLRRVLYRHVPRELIERPKMGFSIPLDSWLRGPLRDWADSLLDPARLAHEGFFRPEPIRERWAEHLSGARNWQHYIWIVLMFQAWLERWRAA
jgi:asparagine synthase (glutamine-hydrolysing)